MKTMSLEREIDRATADTAAARSLFIFLIITFAFSWLLLGLAALSANGALPFSLPSQVMITVATLGPALGAISAAAYDSGRPGVRSLLGQAGRALRLRPSRPGYRFLRSSWPCSCQPCLRKLAGAALPCLACCPDMAGFQPA